MTDRPIAKILTGLALVTGTVLAQPAIAQNSPPAAAPVGESGHALGFADMADLAAAAPMVAIVTVKKISRLSADRTGPVRAGWARAYVEAETKSLLSGASAIGGKVKYLADVKLDSDGRMPKLKKRDVVLFARPVAGRPAELQLVAPDAQVLVGDVGEGRLRAFLAELVSPDAAPEVTGVRDIYHTPGNLAGEGETQIFLATANGDPASIAVLRRPGRAPMWGFSTGELVDPNAGPPTRGTLAWYRLACALPAQLPASAQIADDPSLRRAAAEDYALVMRQLGPCGRERVF